MAASSMQMTLKKLREHEVPAGIVERFVHNKFVGAHGHRSDLFGIFDIVAIKDRITGIQTCCSGQAEHYRKITEQHCAPALKWLSSGGRIELWYWRKVKVKRGGKREIWEPAIREITFDDILPEAGPNDDS